MISATERIMRPACLDARARIPWFWSAQFRSAPTRPWRSSTANRQQSYSRRNPVSAALYSIDGIASVTYETSEFDRPDL